MKNPRTAERNSTKFECCTAGFEAKRVVKCRHTHSKGENSVTSDTHKHCRKTTANVLPRLQKSAQAFPPLFLLVVVTAYKETRLWNSVNTRCVGPPKFYKTRQNPTITADFTIYKQTLGTDPQLWNVKLIKNLFYICTRQQKYLQSYATDKNKRNCDLYTDTLHDNAVFCARSMHTVRRTETFLFHF